MTRCPYLIRRGATYHFRVRTPLRLRPLLGRLELSRSLKTGVLVEARRRCLRMLGLTDELWSALHPAMTPEEAKVLVEAWLTAKLEGDADVRDLPRRPVHDTVMFRRTDPWRPDEVVETLSEAELRERFFRYCADQTALPEGCEFGHKLGPQGIARRNFSKLTEAAELNRRMDDDVIARPVLLAWLEAQGVAADEAAPEFRMATRFMLKALADLQQATAARDAGHWYRYGAPDPAAGVYPGMREAPPTTPSEPAYPQAASPAFTLKPRPFTPEPPQAPYSSWADAPAATRRESPATPQGEERVRFSKAVAEALLEIARTEEQRNMRKEEYAKAVEMFMGWLDRDPYLDEVNARLAGRYKVELTYYPKNASTRRAYRDLTIAERFAAARAAAEPTRLDPATINSNYLTPLRRIFDWMKTAGTGPDINPFAEIRAHKPKRVDPNTKRRDFTDRETAALLALPLFTGSKGHRWKPLYKPGRVRVSDWRFWVPLICLFSGMRLNEACALAVADIKEEDGVPYMHVRDEIEGQNAKSDAARRKAPIHRALLAAGFLDFVAKMRSSGHERLFHDLVVNEDGYVSDVPQKFFVHVIQRAVDPDTDEPGKLVFHSTRHTVISKLRNLNCREDISTEIVGHEKEGTHGKYGSVAVRTLKAWVDQIEYPGVDLDALKQPYSTWREPEPVG